MPSKLCAVSCKFHRQISWSVKSVTIYDEYFGLFSSCRYVTLSLYCSLLANITHFWLPVASICWLFSLWKSSFGKVLFDQWKPRSFSSIFKSSQLTYSVESIVSFWPHSKDYTMLVLELIIDSNWFQVLLRLFSTFSRENCPSTLCRINLKTELYCYGYAFRPH